MLEHLIKKAMALYQTGRLEEAEALYRKVLGEDGTSYPALHFMGLILIRQGRAAEALPFIDRALGIRPATPEILSNRAIALEAVGRHTEALQAFEQVVRLQPASSHAWSNLGSMLSRQGRDEQALKALDRALSYDVHNGEAWSNRGVVLMRLDRHAEALESYDRTLEMRPNDLEARNHRGLALQALGRISDALVEFDLILEKEPRNVGVLINRGKLLLRANRVEEALQCYDRALSLDPNSTDALASRANILWLRKHDLSGALADQEKLQLLSPDHPYGRGDLLHLKTHAALWEGFEVERGALDAAVRNGQRAVQPYVYQALSTSPSDLLACASLYAADKYPARPFFSTKRRRRSGRIRLGYLSGEFRAHATMCLAAGLFERHDRSRFEVIGLDNSRDDMSPMRVRVQRAFDRFLPIQGLSDFDAARLVEREEIDILVNLNGYFGAHRMGVFAHRPAPLQVNYLGFPGTLGAGYIDYILADAEVIPPGDEIFYTERVVRLPESYQINDDQRAEPVPTTRADHGLRETDFVFCHFNYGYKVLPKMFALWLELLRLVPQSVLWLLEGNALFAANLRETALRNGVDPGRLIFALPTAHEKHVSRMMLGDLFLDSLPCNAHTTGSDALWAGLPLVTCRGGTFSGRVGASLLGAAGLGDLVCNSLEDYKETALTLAADRALLRSYRNRLSIGRRHLKLFDTLRSTRHIERAYEEMLARWADGSTPETFAVEVL